MKRKEETILEKVGGEGEGVTFKNFKNAIRDFWN